MGRMASLACAAVFIVGFQLNAAALEGKDYAHIRVVADGANGDAAKTFVRLWQECTGFEAGGPDAPAEPAVYIGHGKLSATARADLDLEGLGEDGVLIKSLADGGLVITGATPRGTRNAVYVFFEEYMGVRWFAHDLTHVPESPPASLADINYRFVPPFQYRWTNSYHGQYGSPAQVEFHEAHRFRPVDHGGAGLHNFYRLVPPVEYFAEHPEYYGMNEAGERVAISDPAQFDLEWGQRDLHLLYQLCMTNPELPPIMAAKLREWFAASSPGAILPMVQEDIEQYCLCPECKAVDTAEGTPMASVLVGVNRTAQRLAQDMPEAKILALAYTYTRKAPKTLKPHDNVYIQLCTIECDFLRPLHERSTEVNQLFMRDLVDWAGITDKLLIYDYAPNFHAWMRPHPNLHVIVPNLRTYAEHGAQGVFVQGNPEPVGGMLALRTYLIAKGLWDPSIGHAAVQRDFMNHYYGPSAAPHMDAYIGLMTETALRKNAVVGCFDDGAWIDAAFVRRALEIVETAMNAAENQERRERIRREWVCLQFAGLSCEAEVTVENGKYILRRPAKVDSAAFLALARELGAIRLDEQYGRYNVPLEESVEEHFGPIGKRKPLEEYPFLAIENSRYAAHIVPELSGAIALLRDKQLGVDVFRGARSVGANRHLLQEWYVQTSGEVTREEPLYTPYEVTAQSPDSVTLRAETSQGLTVIREASLPPGDGPLVLRYTFRNSGVEAVRPLFKIHPEFWTMDQTKPTLWIERDGGWEPKPLKVEVSGFHGGEALDPAGVSRFAAHLPAAKATVSMRVNPEQLDRIFYFFNTKNEHVNLELIPGQAPLAPGESRTLETEIALFPDAPRI